MTLVYTYSSPVSHGGQKVRHYSIPTRLVRNGPPSRTLRTLELDVLSIIILIVHNRSNRCRSKRKQRDNDKEQFFITEQRRQHQRTAEPKKRYVRRWWWLVMAMAHMHICFVYRTHATQQAAECGECSSFFSRRHPPQPVSVPILQSSSDTERYKLCGHKKTRHRI